MFIKGEKKMAGGFAINANEPISCGKGEDRSLEWFKTQLRATGVGPLHITWYAASEYKQVPPECLDTYVALRRTLSHEQALAKALHKE